MQPEGLDPSGFLLRKHNISHGMPPKVPMVVFFNILLRLYYSLRTFSFSHNLTGANNFQKAHSFPIHTYYLYFQL